MSNEKTTGWIAAFFFGVICTVVILMMEIIIFRQTLYESGDDIVIGQAALFILGCLCFLLYLDETDAWPRDDRLRLAFVLMIFGAWSILLSPRVHIGESLLWVAAVLFVIDIVFMRGPTMVRRWVRKWRRHRRIQTQLARAAEKRDSGAETAVEEGDDPE